MDLLDELEHLAAHADEEVEVETGADVQTIERWVKLFGYSRHEAGQKIEWHRSEMNDVKVSADLWELAREEMEENGYDREAYEHLLALGKQKRSSPTPRRSSAKDPSDTIYLVKLDGPLKAPEEVQIAAGLKEAPVRFSGVKLHDDDDILKNDEDFETSDSAAFCQIDGVAKNAIQQWLGKFNSTYRPTFVQITRAEKNLSTRSLAPFLGIDTTLPHMRPSGESPIEPGPKQYPVWYFLYGMLAEASILHWVLQLPKETQPEYRPASVKGGMLLTWGGKYRAMVDAPAADAQAGIVPGKAFLVKDEQIEAKLRFFVTEQYEVVRCSITAADPNEHLAGLTFRFLEA